MDIAIIENSETGGGDWQLKGNDLAYVLGIENQVYLGMFGGNVAAVTNNINPPSELFDYWGNTLFFIDQQAVQFNSITEKTLNTTTLNSRGRTIIQNAIKKDLEFLKTNADIEVEVYVISDDKIRLELKVKQNNNTKIKIINFSKFLNPLIGDFWFLDFNDDFFV